MESLNVLEFQIMKIGKHDQVFNNCKACWEKGACLKQSTDRIGAIFLQNNATIRSMADVFLVYSHVLCKMWVQPFVTGLKN